MSAQRLPVPGSDNGDWGNILNGFLQVSHADDGTLNSGVISNAQIAANAAISPSKVAGTAEVQSNKGTANGYASLNSSSLVPSVQLGTGTASNGNYLRGDGTWAVPNSGSSSLASDTDVTITSPANNQVLTYNSSASAWENQALPAAPVTSVAGKTGVVTLGEGDITGLSTDLAGTEKTANKGTASGYAPLDANAKLPAANLPATIPVGNLPVGTSSTTIAAGNDSRITGALQTSNALSELTSTAATARTNLGLGGAATLSVGTAAGTVMAGNQAAGGDLSGTLNSATVAKIKGITLPASAPTGTGQVLTSSGTTATTWTTPAAGVTLDTTAADIQPLGVQAAGTTGKAADAGHIHAMPTATQVGALASTSDLSAIATANATAGNVNLNSHKITSLTPGTASTDAATFGQIPVAGTTSATYAAGNDSRFAGSAAGTAGAALSATDASVTNSRTPNGTASGDLNGSYPGPTVAKINGVTVGVPTTTGQILTSTSTTAATWQTSTAATSGANSNITSLTGLTTPLSVAQGGTGANTLTGVLKGNGVGALTAATAGTDYLTPAATQTVSATRVNPRIIALTAASNTYTIDGDTTDMAVINTAPTADFTVAAPTGTPVDGQKLMLRIASGATGYTPTWNAIFLSSGIATLPATALPASKTVTFGFVYDANKSNWICLAADTTGY